MSIPLNQSPFQDRHPCFYANEHNGNIRCGCCPGVDNVMNHCDNCENYTPSSDTVDFTWKSLRSILRTEHDDGSYQLTCSHCGSIIPEDAYKAYCPSCGRKIYPADSEDIDVPAGFYQHFKGDNYEVLGVARHTETGEKLVVYRALYGTYGIYVGPLNRFVEVIEDLTYHYRGPRFYRIDETI